MMFLFVPQKLFLFLCCLFLVSCSHLNEKIKKLPYHTPKTKVLDNLGQPFQIKRIDGLDHWIYKFKLNGKEYTKSVIFKEGYFLKSGQKKAYPDLEVLLQESENFEEYERAVKIIKRSRRKKK